MITQLIVIGIIGIILGCILGTVLCWISDKIEAKRERGKAEEKRVDICMFVTCRSSFNIQEKCIYLTRDQVNELLIVWKKTYQNRDWVCSEEATKMLESWQDLRNFGLEVPRPCRDDYHLVVEHFNGLIRGKNYSIMIYDDRTHQCAIFASNYERARQEAEPYLQFKPIEE